MFMGLKINNIIVLENEEQYILLKDTMYYGKKYFLGMGIDENMKVINSKVVIFEEHVSGYDTYVSKVAQKELITVLTRMFKAQI